MCFLRKALDNIDLNQMSHRYVSGALQNDWDVPLDFRSLDRSQRGCCIWVYIVWVIKWSIWSFPVYITQKNLKSVIDSAVLHWTTRLMSFRETLGLVSTRHEILSNIDRNAKPNRNSAAAPRTPKWNKSRESTDPIPGLLLSLQSQTVVFQPFDFHVRKFKSPWL